MFEIWILTKYYRFQKWFNSPSTKKDKRPSVTEYVLLILVVASVAFKFRTEIKNKVLSNDRYPAGWIDSVQHPSETLERNYGIEQ